MQKSLAYNCLIKNSLTLSQEILTVTLFLTSHTQFPSLGVIIAYQKWLRADRLTAYIINYT